MTNVAGDLRQGLIPTTIEASDTQFFKFLYERATSMSRLIYSLMFAFCVSLFSFSVVGCGPGDNEVIEDTRSEAEINKEEEDYDKMMDSTEDVTQ